MGKENQRPPASRFLFIITPLFPHCTPLSACVLCVLVGLYPSRLLRLDVFTTCVCGHYFRASVIIHSINIR